MSEFFKRDVDPIIAPCCEMWTTHAMTIMKELLENDKLEESNISFGRSLPFPRDRKKCLADTYIYCNKEYSFISEYYRDEEPEKFKADMDNVEVILFMVLGYPFKFGFCTLDDFRDTYLNGRTDIKVELDIDGVFFELNRCVPLLRTTISELKKVLLGNGGGRFDYCQLASIVRHQIELYFDYLVYSMEQYYEEKNNGREVWEEATPKERNIFYSYRRHSFVDIEHLKQSYSTTKVVRNKYARHNEFEVCSHTHPYFVTTMDEYGRLSDRWMFFDEFIREAKKIRKMVGDPDKGQQLLVQYPELKKMVDIEELFIYDCLLKYGGDVDLSFLKKDWYDEQLGNEDACGFFLDEDGKLKDPSNEIFVTMKNYYLSRCSYDLRDKIEAITDDQLKTISRTTWGFKKEPNTACKLFLSDQPDDELDS